MSERASERASNSTQMRCLNWEWYTISTFFSRTPLHIYMARFVNVSDSKWDWMCGLYLVSTHIHLYSSFHYCASIWATKIITTYIQGRCEDSRHPDANFADTPFCKNANFVIPKVHNCCEWSEPNSLKNSLILTDFLGFQIELLCSIL